MGKIEDLLDNYREHIGLPWLKEKSAQQRVIFCVYPQYVERRLVANVDEFELATKESGHDWEFFDMSDFFPAWLADNKYKKKYFQDPTKFENITTKFPGFIKDELEQQFLERKVGANSVVAVAGIGTLFGFVKVKEVIELIAPLVPGRLVVFFPGSYDNNNYRLLDGYDGWGYLAVPITSDQ